MSRSEPDPHVFYEQVLPGDFNQMLTDQEALGEAGRPVLESMRAVNGTICVEITGTPEARFALNVERGRMHGSQTPAHPPFLTLIQDRAAFRVLAGEAKGSLTALLGALAGLGGEMRLTRKRMLDLEAVDGLIHFEVTGDGGFSVQSHFGTGPRPAEPDAAIRLDAAAYADLRNGVLDPQNAFLSGRVDVTGDMEKVMQLAFAAVAPD